MQAALARTNGQSNPPAVHKTDIIVANNNETATKSTYLWNKSTILPVYPQITAICGQIAVNVHNIARIVTTTMQVTEIDENWRARNKLSGEYWKETTMAR